MEKKLISSAIASAVAISAALPVIAANPNAKPPLPGPLEDVFCEQVEDGVNAGWYDPNGDDYFEGDTKFGGDLEVDAEFFFYCEAEGESFGGSETGSVDVDLSRDESAPFFYVCEDVGEEDAACSAHIDWEDLANVVDEAAAEHFPEQQAECESIGGTFYTSGATLESVATFGVKEMNPGKGNGRQNYEKSFASCDIEPAPIP